MYDEMMESWLRVVLRPLVVTHIDDPVLVARYNKDGLWVRVKDSCTVADGGISYAPNEVWKNLFSWKAYTRRRRLEVLVQQAY